MDDIKMNSSPSDGLKNLMLKARCFVKERGWEDYHSPKNLSMALSIEAGELMEIFQWMNEEESLAVKDNENKMQMIRDEIADIFHCLLRLSDVLDIDVEASFFEKIKKNELKYPKDKVFGKNSKYSEIE